MKKAAEYLDHAAECRKLAAGMEGDHRDQLLKMAETWERLAAERKRSVIIDEDPSFDRKA